MIISNFQENTTSKLIVQVWGQNAAYISVT